MHYKKASVVLSGAMQNFANTEKKKGALKVYILSAPTLYSVILDAPPFDAIFFGLPPPICHQPPCT